MTRVNEPDFCEFSNDLHDCILLLQLLLETNETTLNLIKHSNSFTFECYIL